MAVPVVIEYRLGSVEYVRAEVSSKTRTGAQLAALTVEMAFPLKGVQPVTGDWGAAAWEASPGANKAVARRLRTHSVVGTFDVYTRHTDTPEVPIKSAGQIRVK